MPTNKMLPNEKEMPTKPKPISKAETARRLRKAEKERVSAAKLETERTKKRIQALQRVVKKISPNISLRSDLKAPQWNSKNAETIYTEYIEKNAPNINTKKVKSVTRSSLYKQAKELGWTKGWNKSAATEMIDYINNDLGLGGNEWQTSFTKIFESRKPFSDRQLELLKAKTIDTPNKYFLEYRLKGDDSLLKIPIHNLNMDNLSKLLKNYYIENYETNPNGSGTVENMLVQGIESMAIHEIPAQTKKRVLSAKAGWANFYNESEIDLHKYQIYNQEQDSAAIYETCILWSLKQCGISPAVINQIKSIFGEQQVYDVQFKHLPKICDLIERKVCLHKYRKETPNKLQTPIIYGEKYKNRGEPIHIAVYREHAFVYEQTKYTACYIKNYKALGHAKVERHYSCTKVIDGKAYYNHTPSYLNSLALVKLLDEQGHFSTYRSTVPSQAIVKPEPSLDLIELEQRPFGCVDEKKKKRTPKRIVVLAADFETEVCNGIHKGIMFSCKEINDRSPATIIRPKSTGDDWEKKFMNQVRYQIANLIGKYDPKTTEIQMYFHNLKYDFTIFSKYFFKTGVVESGGSLYESTIVIHSNDKMYLVKCRDSLKFFNCRLSKLPAMFNLPVQKEEAIAYEYYTHINIQSDDAIPKTEYEKYLPDQDTIAKFRKITRKVKTFNPVEYYMSYLRADVEVLALALLSFGEIIEDLTGVQLGEKMTISSIGHDNAVKRGCYEGCFETFGNLRMFIQQAVKGGRVYANPKHRRKVINGPIEDFDAVSMYPSAMCRMKGCPIGSIKRGEEQTFEYYESKDYYITKIRITRIGRKRDVPVVTIKEDDGSIRYVNEVDAEGLVTTVDMITLQDYIKYAQIEYEIIEGIYWDEGFNTKIGETMLELHNERNKYKSTNKPKADMIKLLMNSTYGKTIQKLSDKKVAYHKAVDQENYIHENFGQILEIEESGDQQIKITSRDYDLSYSLNYVGVYILSTSKRMMNEVFDCMETVGSPMYYTDTDSIHLPQADIPEIARIYKERYGGDLIGKNLGQFHTDFSMDGCRDVYSIKSIFLGSKVYIDVLRGIDEKTGEVKHDVHMRMKGVNSAGIEYEIHEISPDPDKRIETAFGIYEKLCDPTYSHEFCINPTKSNVSFDHTKAGIITRETGTFTRVISFK